MNASKPIFIVLVLVLVILVSGCTSNDGSQCPQCPSPGSYSECDDQGIMTRTNYRCSEATGYQCESYAEEKTCTTGITEGSDAESDTENAPSEASLGPDAAGDCSLLTPEDILNVCGVETTAEIQETEEGYFCETMFVKTGAKYGDRIYQSVTIRYDEDYDPDSDDANTTFKKWANTGEKLSDHAIFIPAAGDWSIIFGTKYKIIVHNTVYTHPDVICTPDNIKELGILVSDRIYG